MAEDPTSPSTTRLATGATRLLAPVVAAAALIWLALAAWAFASPVGAAPDDDYHLAMLYCAAGEADCTREGTRIGPCFAMKPDLPATCGNEGTLTLPSTRGIITGHYPPLYYATASVLVGPTLTDTTRAVRLLNITMATALALGSVLLTTRTLRPAVALATAVAAVPLGMYFLASMNPTAWVVMGLAALWGPLLSWLTAPGGAGATWPPKPTRGLTVARLGFIAFCALMGLGTRSEAALWLPLVTAAVTVFAVPWPLAKGRDPQAWLRLLVPVILVAASALALLIFGQGKAERLTSGTSPTAAEPYQGWAVVQHTVNSFLGMLGLPGVPGSSLGTYDVPVPAAAAAAVVFAAGATALIGLGVIYGRKAIALVGLGSATFTLVALLWSRQTWEYYQPRYFLPLWFVALGLVLVPRPVTAPRGAPAPGLAPPGLLAPTFARATAGSAARSPWPGTALQLGMILAASTLANSLALLSTLLRYLRGVDYQPSRDPLTQNAPAISPGELLALGEPSWWFGPISPFSTWVVGTLAFAAVAAGLWWFVIRASTATGTPGTNR